MAARAFWMKNLEFTKLELTRDQAKLMSHNCGELPKSFPLYEPTAGALRNGFGCVRESSERFYYHPIIVTKNNCVCFSRHPLVVLVTNAAQLGTWQETFSYKNVAGKLGVGLINE